MTNKREVKLFDRVKELSYDPGSSSFTLAGAPNGFSPFNDFLYDGDVIYYAATDGTRYEVGSGVYKISGSSRTINRFPLRSNRISAGPYYLNAASSHGATRGRSGYYHPLYLTESFASGIVGFAGTSSSVHEHQFSGYPGVTFYMPSTHAGHHEKAGGGAPGTLSGVNYATSGAAVSFVGVTEVYVTYPGKTAVLSSHGVSGFQEPKHKGVAFWGSEQVLDYDSNIIWEAETNRLGVKTSSPGYAIDVGGDIPQAIVRASGFLDGGSGVLFAGVTGSFSGGRQLEPFLRNKLDSTTGTDAVFSLDGLVDEKIDFQKQHYNTIFAGPSSGVCGGSCSAQYPTFRLLNKDDIPDLSSLYVKQEVDKASYLSTVGSVAFLKTSGVIEYDPSFVWIEASNRLGINTASPQASLHVVGDANISSSLSVGGDLFVSGDLTYIDATNLAVLDKQIELASQSGNAVYADATIDDGGIILRSDSAGGDKRWTWRDGLDCWRSSEHVALEGDKKIIFSGGDIYRSWRINDGLYNAPLANQVSGQQITISGQGGLTATWHKNLGCITIDPSGDGKHTSLSGVLMYTASQGAGSYSWKARGGGGAVGEPTLGGGQEDIANTNVVTFSGVSGLDVTYRTGPNLLVFNPYQLSGSLQNSFRFRHNNTSVDATYYVEHNDQVTVSGLSGIGVHYNPTTSHFTINPAYGGPLSLSGTLQGGIDNVGAASNWKARHNATLAGDTITGGQAVTVSGLSGIVINYDASTNQFDIRKTSSAFKIRHNDSATADPITDGETIEVSGISGVIVNYNASANRLDIRGNFDESLSAATGLKKTSGGLFAMDPIGSGYLQHLIFLPHYQGIRIGHLAADRGTRTLGDWQNLQPGAGSGAMSIGNAAAYGALLNDHTVFIGSGAGYAASGNSYCVAVGGRAADQAKGVIRGIFVGHSAGSHINGGVDTFTSAPICIGHSAGHNASGADQSVMIGRKTAKSAWDIDNSVAIGLDAGSYSSGIDVSVVIGDHTAHNLVNASKSIMIGASTAKFASGIHRSVFVGNEVGYKASGHDSNLLNKAVFIGDRAGRASYDLENSIAIGPDAAIDASGQGDSSTTNSIFIGLNAGASATEFNHVVSIGSNPNQRLSSSSYVNSIGHRAGADGDDIHYSNIIGYLTGRDAGNIDYSTFMGASAGYLASGVSKGSAIGHFAASKADSLSNAEALGAYALSLASGHTYSSAMGYEAGYNTYDADSSIFIGREAGKTSSNSNYEIHIGHRAGFRTGGKSSSTNDNIYVGTMAGSGRYGDDCIIIGNFNSTHRHDNVLTHSPPWSDADSDGILAIGTLITGKDRGAAVRRLRLGKEPSNESEFTNICTSIKPGQDSDTALELRPFSSAQTAPYLATRTATNNDFHPVINHHGFLQLTNCVAVTGAGGAITGYTFNGNAVDNAVGTVVLDTTYNKIAFYTSAGWKYAE